MYREQSSFLSFRISRYSRCPLKFLSIEKIGSVSFGVFENRTYVRLQRETDTRIAIRIDRNRDYNNGEFTREVAR